MKKLWRVELSRTEAREILVYAEDADEAGMIASDEGVSVLDEYRSGRWEVEVSDPVEVVALWPVEKLPYNELLKLSRTALPRQMEGDRLYGDMGDIDEDLTARQVLELLVEERRSAEARAAEDAKQGKLFGGGK